MSLEDTAKHMAEKDFRQRWKHSHYNIPDQEQRRFLKMRYDYWYKRIKQERGYK